jgi:dynein assembly factor 1, axonemal
MEMTRKTLQQLCKQHSLYRTPHLNDKLYANFQGFSAIENLEEYSALKALFLEGNSLTDLDGLPHLPELKCLYAALPCIALCHPGSRSCSLALS